MAKRRSLSEKRPADDSDGSSSILERAAEDTLRRLAAGVLQDMPSVLPSVYGQPEV
eukprot:CAMPEP_0198217824 /NCGR_PEP_ID=MMETSP1445-20131203/66047_1 /TAXON_ID=36898 /ORGANISM="Pyramimonas sp., Strain CCMP2087" /LENGTH=55 /DNA_ID=CAMNT_0043894645 /DNA_START=84 /DNA_END=248 /DNA_ORIENTATION=-